MYVCMYDEAVHGHGHGGNTYTCTRCGEKGHQMKYCPTLNDPAFDTDNRLMNIPKNTILTVDTLEGIDVTNKMVRACICMYVCMLMYVCMYVYECVYGWRQ